MQKHKNMWYHGFMKYLFSAIFTKEKGGYSAFCSELGVVSQGKTLSEAEANIREAVGLYIDDSNLYKRGKATGWMTDYKKLYAWVASLNTIVHARIYKCRPRYEQQKSISDALEKYFKSIGY